MLNPPEPFESPFKGKSGVARMLQAFLTSAAGLKAAWRHERAFRQEIALALVLIPSACMLPVSAVERAMLIGTVLLVLIVELLNTSVEAAIDRISLETHALSKRAKDIGSAAVFMALVLLAVVWALIVAPVFA